MNYFIGEEVLGSVSFCSHLSKKKKTFTETRHRVFSSVSFTEMKPVP